MQADLIKRFKISKPSILITGLNPHAGEMGYLGKEEQEVIIPVVEKLKIKGLDLKGPVPAGHCLQQKHFARNRCSFSYVS